MYRNTGPREEHPLQLLEVSVRLFGVLLEAVGGPLEALGGPIGGTSETCIHISLPEAAQGSLWLLEILLNPLVVFLRRSPPPAPIGGPLRLPLDKNIIIIMHILSASYSY